MDQSTTETGLLDALRAMFDNKGTYKSSAGYSYEGEWRDNMKHGKGKFFFADGKVYEGEFVAGKKQGVGTFDNEANIS